MSNYGRLSPAFGAYNNAFVRLCKGVFSKIVKCLNYKTNLVGTAGFEPTTTTPPVFLEKSAKSLLFLPLDKFSPSKLCKSLPKFGPVWPSIGVRA